MDWRPISDFSESVQEAVLWGQGFWSSNEPEHEARPYIMSYSYIGPDGSRRFVSTEDFSGDTVHVIASAFLPITPPPER